MAEGRKENGEKGEGVGGQGRKRLREVKMEKLHEDGPAGGGKGREGGDVDGRRRGKRGKDDCRRRRRLFRFVMGKADTHRGART